MFWLTNTNRIWEEEYTLVTNYFKKIRKSKKGFTLVEAMCSIMIMAIVFVGILNAVSFSRQMVFTNNSREKASDKGQLVADEIISIATGYDPGEPIDPTVTGNLSAAINAVLNNGGTGTANDDPQYEIIGAVEYVASFPELADYDPSTSAEIQYTLTPVSASLVDTEVDGVTAKFASERGWDIKVRVYYQSVGAGNGYNVAELTAFAPTNYIE